MPENFFSIILHQSLKNQIIISFYAVSYQLLIPSFYLKLSKKIVIQ